jgi:hypothetical protein
MRIEIERQPQVRSTLIAVVIAVLAILFFEIVVKPVLFDAILMTNNQFMQLGITLALYVVYLIIILAIAESFLRSYFTNSFIIIEKDGLTFASESSIPIPWFNTRRFLPFYALETITVRSMPPSAGDVQDSDIVNLRDKTKNLLARDVHYLVIYPKKGTGSENVKMFGISFSVPFYSYSITSKQAGLIENELKNNVGVRFSSDLNEPGKNPTG